MVQRKITGENQSTKERAGIKMEELLKSLFEENQRLNRQVKDLEYNIHMANTIKNHMAGVIDYLENKNRMLERGNI